MSGVLLRILGLSCLVIIAAFAGPGASLAAKPTWQQPMKVVIVRSSEKGCEPVCSEWIMAEGMIVPETVEVFTLAYERAMKRSSGRPLPVVLRSPGGNIFAALQIGYFIQFRRADVAIGTTVYKGCDPFASKCKQAPAEPGVYRGQLSINQSYCLSACPLILAAGARRIAPSGTTLGVHHWGLDEPAAKAQKVKPSKVDMAQWDKIVDNVMSDYLRKMGNSPGLIADMKKASFSSMYLLSAKRRSQLGLVTEAVSPNVLSRAKNCSSDPPAGNCVLSGNSDIYRQSLYATGVSADDSPMSIAVVRDSRPGCEPVCAQWIVMKGTIGPGTPKTFAAVLARLGKQKLPVLIDSRGGDLDAAMEIGRMIHKRGLDVAVSLVEYNGCPLGGGPCRPPDNRNLMAGAPRGTSDGCRGACVFVVAAGRQRAMQQSGTLTIFSPALLVSRGRQNLTQLAIREYLAEVATDATFITAMNAVERSSPRQLKEKQAAEIGLLTPQDGAAAILGAMRCAVRPMPAHCIKARK